MTGKLRHRLRRVRDDDSGMSLVELLVSGVLSIIVLVMIATMFIQVTKITTASNQTHNSNSVVANVSNELSAVLRVGTTLAKSNVATPDPAIVAGTRNSVTLYSLSNTSATSPAPVRVTFTLSTTGPTAGRITEDRCVGVASGGYWTFGSCASTSTRILGEGVIAPTGVTNQLFTYNDVNGAPILLASGGTGSLTSAQRALVASITVIVRGQAPGSNTAPVLVKNTVVLRNLGLDTST